MTRRTFLSMAAGALGSLSPAPVSVPVRLVLDGRVNLRPPQLHHFWSHLWPQAVRDFERGGIRIESSFRTGDIWRPDYREPVITGLEPGVINLVITNQIPLQWDNGRALSGAATRYRGYDLCIVALDHAHGNELPFLSVNTCVHELLHVLMQDVRERRPKGLRGDAREFRIDWYATLLWLFHDGADIRNSARALLNAWRSDRSADFSASS